MAKLQDIRNRTRRSNGTRSTSQVTTIVRHHSATDSGNFDSFWRYWNGTLGWGTGGYHEIILRDGTVQLCYDPHEITNGVGGNNSYTYHICLVGDGSFTAAQEKAWDERVAYNMERLGIGVSNVKGHREMPGANTACPGINMDTVRSRIRGGGSSSSSTSSSSMASSSGVKWIGTDDKGKELIVKASALNYYDSPRWSNPTGSKPRGFKWKIDNLYEVNGSRQYRVQDANGNLFFTSARSDLVRVGGTYGGGGGNASSGKGSKTIAQMADEVEAGKHGTGHAKRRKSLGISRKEYAKVRAEVNRRAKGGGNRKSISQMATEVLRGEHGDGHSKRRKSLGISRAEYRKVRAEVNRRA